MATVSRVGWWHRRQLLAAEQALVAGGGLAAINAGLAHPAGQAAGGKLKLLGHGIAGEALLQAELHSFRLLLRREPAPCLGVGLVIDGQSGGQDVTLVDLSSEPGEPQPKPQAQRNFTDPDSHILKGSGGWMQGYNAQAAVDGDHQVIVAIGVSNQPSDALHLLPMLGRIQANTGQMPGALIADAGYCSTANLEACERRGLAAYISTSRQQHGQKPRPSRGPAPRDLDVRGRMDRKLRSKAGQAIYALRKTIVEPVFGQIKCSRGLNGFRLRGLEKVNGDWALMATTHNILKLFRASLVTG